ncbi:MAG: penicillin-binding protein [Lachnospiraceae bacterium]|nr:penicillin-binding protein [Lachnospiraceae bacterium]
MIKRFKDNYINTTNGRIIVLLLVIFLLSSLLTARLFVLQIINGEETLEEFTLKIQKERTINSTRGKIFDRNGVLLAYNELAYNVTIEDVYESGTDKNKNINETLLKVIKIIEKNGDKIVNDFSIILDENGEFAFTLEGTQQKRFLADIYGRTKISDLKYKEETASADMVMEYLCGYSKYGIGESLDPENPRDSFVVFQGYTKEEQLKLVTIRYAMSLNSFQQYIPTVIATDVDEKTVASIMENSTEFTGVSITEDNIRKYVDSKYFSQILGYTGKISEEEYLTLNNQEITENNERTTRKRNDYTLTDMIGKAGIEQTMETYLQGVKGHETIFVNNLGKVIESTNLVEPVAGNDVHLTIDHDLQVAAYNILEQKLAGILLSKIINVKEYNPPERPSASQLKIPIDDVYFALFNNNVIDIKQFEDEDAGENEKAVYEAFIEKQNKVFERLTEELNENRTPYKELPEEYQIYQSYIVSMLSAEGILLNDKIDKEDEVYRAWKTEETISLREFLDYCISQNWIDVTRIALKAEYSDSSEIFQQLTADILELLKHNTEFSKKLYRYMINGNNIDGRQICMILLEQDAVSITEKEEEKFITKQISPYNFMLFLIENLYITPAQLALDPYSASVVITNVEGEVLALVTYPSYDNNRLANSIDSEYYASLRKDLSNPLWNYATQQKTAPGSTFKMVSATAALCEEVVTTKSTITCKGLFDRFANEQYRCWIYPGAHGSLTVSGGIENSCNAFFYEVGYQLSQTADGAYDADLGLEKLSKYADLYGLSEKSGVEIEESVPEVSDEYPVLSAIGQGTNNYTTVGLARYITTVANSGTCYNLTLLDKVTDSNGNLIVDYSPSVRNTIELPASYWNAIHSGMKRVVEKKTYYQDLGVTVAGKTGTAEENRNRANHALFVSYAPFENPEITVSTRIAFGYTSEYAANLTRDIYKYYFDLEEEDSILTGTAVIPDAAATTAD